MDRWISTSAASLAAISGVGGLAKLLSFKWAGGIAIASALIGATAATIAARQTTEEAVNRADFPGGHDLQGGPFEWL